MRIIETKTYAQLSMLAADILTEQICAKPDSVLGLATGSSPIGMYEVLVDRYNKGELDFSRITSVNLDEYIGLDGSHPQSYRYFMDTHLFNLVNIDKANTFVPNGLTQDGERDGILYDAHIEALGGIDLQLLGVGYDGHIGFNEPSDTFAVHTHVETLDPSTIEANARFFDSIEDVPTQAMTMGLGSIMKAKKILLIASGEKKAKVLREAFSGKVTPKIPASILQLHPDVTVIISEN